MATSAESSVNGDQRSNDGASSNQAKHDSVQFPTPLKSESPALLVVFCPGQEGFVQAVGDVLAQESLIINQRSHVHEEALRTVIGVTVEVFLLEWTTKDLQRTTIIAHDIDDGLEAWSDALTELCHYEYLYRRSSLDRRDLARYLSFITGQISPHEDLAQRERTTLISTTFADITAALPNLEILSVGADSVELRVDLLKEPLSDGSFSEVPSLKYVGEQVMLLRQRTELPIIYTTRCTKENGRFPMGDPKLVYLYLYKAIQWGCEYIDVELWLPEEIRRSLAESKGASKIISAFHEFSGGFKWSSPEALDIFKAGAVYSDVVKMNVLITSIQDNYELEAFRSKIQAEYTKPLFSGLNMGRAGQISRSFNKVFTPITHPLLPMVAAPGQLSAAEINHSLHSMGELPKLDIYGIGYISSTSQATFFEKCFNELSLPHQFISLEREPDVEALIKQPKFGGAYFNPPSSVRQWDDVKMSRAAEATGLVDTIFVKAEGTTRSIIGENATWKGIRATLTSEFVPTSYHGRAVLLLASSENDAASAIYALKEMKVGPIYTIGFKTKGALAEGLTPLTSVEDLTDFEHPFAIINALPGEKSLLVGPLLKHYSSIGRQDGVVAGKVFLDLTEGPKKGDPIAIAASLGWISYGMEEVRAWTTMETLRMLVGQNVPYDFVRLACGKASY
jgi:3-dehydroquinate dehydratase-1